MAAMWSLLARAFNFTHDKTPYHVVTGITKTSSRHDAIRDDVGNEDMFDVKTYDELEGNSFKDVVFCAPPSGFEDYPAAVGEAAKSVWAGAKSGGTFVFTSSGGV
jgi:hypothetical protein